jgi:hypothetical protein
VIGALVYDKSDLEKYKAKGEKLNIKMMGLLHLVNNIPASLAVEVIEAVQVRGIFNASSEVKEALTQAGKVK